MAINHVFLSSVSIQYIIGPKFMIYNNCNYFTSLALYMKDFTHMNENKKFVEGLINFTKIRNMHKVVSLILLYLFIFRREIY